jgi:fatty-acid desaturase
VRRRRPHPGTLAQRVPPQRAVRDASDERPHAPAPTCPNSIRNTIAGLGALVWAPGGLDAVLVCLCPRTAAGILGHWFVGYAAHAWGERRYVIRGAKESGTNTWILGVLAFGEGFHNNHHAYPESARMGLKPHEIDLGWLSLRAFEKLGWVRDVNNGPERTARNGRILN